MGLRFTTPRIELNRLISSTLIEIEFPVFSTSLSRNYARARSISAATAHQLRSTLRIWSTIAVLVLLFTNMRLIYLTCEEAVAFDLPTCSDLD